MSTSIFLMIYIPAAILTFFLIALHRDFFAKTFIVEGDSLVLCALIWPLIWISLFGVGVSHVVSRIDNWAKNL